MSNPPSSVPQADNDPDAILALEQQAAQGDAALASALAEVGFDTDAFSALEQHMALYHDMKTKQRELDLDTEARKLQEQQEEDEQEYLDRIVGDARTIAASDGISIVNRKIVNGAIDRAVIPQEDAQQPEGYRVVRDQPSGPIASGSGVAATPQPPVTPVTPGPTPPTQDGNNSAPPDQSQTPKAPVHPAGHDLHEHREKRVRAWLRLYKIYFETVAVVLLALMSLTVAAASAWIAKQQTDVVARQTDLIARQTDLMGLQEVPLFHFEPTLVKNQQTGNYDWQDLTIANEGAPITQFDYKDASFFVLERYSFGKPWPDAYVVSVPIDNYFGHYEYSGDLKGDLVTAYSDQTGNWGSVSRLLRRVYASNPPSSGSFLCGSFFNYWELQYTDQSSQNHTVYYLASSADGVGADGTPIDNTTGATIFQEWENGFTLNEKVDFYNRSDSTLYQAVDLVRQKRVKEHRTTVLPPPC
jgi:hypothetical protein